MALKADRMRLDAFQAYYLRCLFHIAPSYISRVSNASVLERGGQMRFSSILEDRQRHLFTKIQCLPASAFVKIS